MDAEQIARMLRTATAGSLLILLPSAAVESGEHLVKFKPDRPQVPAACMPIWGYNPTCWRQFPPVPPCDQFGQCAGNFGQYDFGLNNAGSDPAAWGQIYTPQPPREFSAQSAVPQSKPLSVFPPQQSSVIVPGQGVGNGSVPTGLPAAAPLVQPLPEIPGGLPSVPAGQPQQQSRYGRPSRYGISSNAMGTAMGSSMGTDSRALVLPPSQIVVPGPPMIRTASTGNARYGTATQNSMAASGPQQMQSVSQLRTAEFPLIQSSGFPQVPSHSASEPLRRTP